MLRRTPRPGEPSRLISCWPWKPSFAKTQWSPEQISAGFRKQDLGRISHEAICQHIYRDKRTGGHLHRHLRDRYKSYRKRGLGRERRGRIKD